MGVATKHVVPESSNSSQTGFNAKKPVASVSPLASASHLQSPSPRSGNHPVAPLPREVREYFVDAIEAGKFLQLHWRTIQRLAREGIIPAHPFGSGPRKTWRFLLSELDAWMRSQVNSACRP